MNERVTIEDLAFAAEWLRCYEAAPGEEDNDDRAERVAAWLEAEVKRREDAAYGRARAKALDALHGWTRDRVRGAR